MEPGKASFECEKDRIISWKTIVEGLHTPETNFLWKWKQKKLRLSVKRSNYFVKMEAKTAASFIVGLFDEKKLKVK